MSDSPRWHLSKTDAIKVGWFLFHGLVGTTILTLLDVFAHTDFGPYSPLVAVGIAGVSKFVAQWIGGTPCVSAIPADLPINTPVAVMPEGTPAAV